MNDAPRRGEFAISGKAQLARARSKVAGKRVAQLAVAVKIGETWPT